MIIVEAAAEAGIGVIDLAGFVLDEALAPGRSTSGMTLGAEVVEDIVGRLALA